MSTSWSLQFPLPLSAAVEQLYVLGSAQGYGREDDAGLVRVFLPNSPNAVNEKAQMATAREKESQNGTSSHVSKVGMIGLGAMGQGMAASLLRAGYTVQGYDVAPQAVDRFLVNNSNAVGMNSPSEAVKDAEVVILMVQNAAQAHEALFGSGKAAEKLSDGAVIILSSTVPPSFVRNLEKRLDALGKHIMLVDAPVSGGVRRAADGSLTVSEFFYSYSKNSTKIEALDHLLRQKSCNPKSQGPIARNGRKLNQFVSHSRRCWRCIVRQAHQPTSRGDAHHGSG